MKFTPPLLFILLLQSVGWGAVSLEATDEGSLFLDSDPAMKDIKIGENDSPASKALLAFQAGDYQDAVALALPLVASGDTDAIYLLGFAHETGRGVRQSREKAIEYYEKGAERAHADSIYRLSFLLMGSEDEATVRRAQRMLEKQAETDPQVAGRILGEAFVRGRLGKEPDPETGISWWEKASEAGDVPSMNFLAAFYDGQMGFPDKRDPALAMEYYGSAAATGDTAAMINLGSRLLTGDEKLRDEEKGREWIDKAIAAKEASGYLVLGAYQEGVKEDVKAAFSEYLKGAEAGQVDCMIRAAAMYAKGEGAEKDEAKATDLLEKAAEGGSAQAHLELAALIMSKEKPDLAAGYAHLLTAANAGLPFAQNELGIFYLSGSLGVADPSAAVSWFTRAAKDNFAPAQNNLATLYERGAGVPQGFDNALQLYGLAAKQGHPGATLALARLNAAGAGTEQNFELAWAFAKIAEERGEINAPVLISELEKNLTEEQLASAKKQLEQLKSGKKSE